MREALGFGSVWCCAGWLWTEAAVQQPFECGDVACGVLAFWRFGFCGVCHCACTFVYAQKKYVFTVMCTLLCMEECISRPSRYSRVHGNVGCGVLSPCHGVSHSSRKSWYSLRNHYLVLNRNHMSSAISLIFVSQNLPLITVPDP